MEGPSSDTIPLDADLACQIALSAPGSAAEAEDALYRRYAPRMRLYALRRLRDRSAAADFAQQVLVMVIERLRQGKLRDPAKLGSFVFGIGRLAMLELHRGGARRSRLLELYARDVAIASPDHGPELDEERVARCLERLGERERSVLVMTFLEERSSDEVAAALGLTSGNVRVIRHRGLERLRRCVLGEEGPS